MELPKFILGDNTDFETSIFVIHTEYPRFIINLEDDDIEWFEDFDAEDEKELLIETEKLIEEAGMGDDQFDEDGGEGDTMAVERERDRVLSDQARQTIEEIDGALLRIETGDYGYSTVSTRPIPRERLEVIPWAIELVEERVGWR